MVITTYTKHYTKIKEGKQSSA